MSEEKVRRFAERHPHSERKWKEMSATEREWWRRKYEEARRRVRETEAGGRGGVYR